MTRIRHLFPGGNTCNGFHSFYDFIVPNQARLKLVLKGGPGVGKSTLMKKLGEEFIDLGYRVEFHWCSSDNESLDAIALPDYDIAVVDGTAPHRVVSAQETADKPSRWWFSGKVDSLLAI